MDRLTRSFLAIEFSDSLKQEAQLFVDKIKSQYPNFRFIPPQNWHLTLHFFGSVTYAQIEEMKVELPEFLKDVQPFSIFFKGMDAFPDHKKARILWLGISGDDVKLLNLKMRIDTALSKMKFEVEKRAFRPHLTVARLKGAFSKTPSNVSSEFKTKTVDLVQHVTLFESQPSPDGAVYKALHMFSLSAL
jgi:RNA 2',3'-cyclic 3'-phosphodiesterase